jgi:hypothetical protein
MPIELIMRIGGGYALVYNATQDKFDVASIKPTDSTHVLHRLTVRISGQATSTPTPPDELDPQTQTMGWNLNTRVARMEVWPGGTIPRGDVCPPDAADCAELLPDVPELGRSALAPDWTNRILSRMTLRTGRLKVDRLKPAQGKIQFRHATKAPKPLQKFAHGVTGLIYRIVDPNVSFVTLALFPLGTTDADILNGAVPTKFELTPAAGSSLIKLQVDAIEPAKPMVDGMDLEELGIFYNLLTPVPSQSFQYIPRWHKPEGFDASPGSECPPGYYDDVS